MIPFDPEALRTSAVRLCQRARYVAFVYAFVAFCVGVPLGACAMVNVNMALRMREVRTRADYDDIVHSEDKGEEVKSLLRRTPLAGAMAGVVFLCAGLVIGLQRASTLKAQGQMALCLLQIEANTRGTRV